MTVPIHSVKHIKSDYHRYQIMAVASAIITIVAIILAAVTSFQVTRMGKMRADAAAASQNQADETLKRETAVLKERISQMEQQLAAEKAVVQQLNSKINTLQNQLNESRPAGNGAVEGQPANPAQTGKAVPVSDTSQPVQGWKPSSLTPSPATTTVAVPASKAPATGQKLFQAQTSPVTAPKSEPAATPETKIEEPHPAARAMIQQTPAPTGTVLEAPDPAPAVESDGDQTEPPAEGTTSSN